jgi:hypothetical protein
MTKAHLEQLRYLGPSGVAGGAWTRMRAAFYVEPFVHLVVKSALLFLQYLVRKMMLGASEDSRGMLRHLFVSRIQFYLPEEVTRI